MRVVGPKPAKLNPGEKRYALRIVEERRTNARDAKWDRPTEEGGLAILPALDPRRIKAENNPVYSRYN